MNLSEPFIKRPVGTTLLAIGLVILGIVAYRFLPVASLPTVDLPTIVVSASRPGADPASMAASVAAPLERHLGTIAGITQLTSVSSLGSSSIVAQFDLSRSVDGAAQDVQAALNAAATDLPGDLPTLPSFRKINPAAAPVLILALTSDTVPASAIYDAADTIAVQRISQVDGVGQVSVSGADQPAVRVRLDPDRLSAMGLALDDVRTAIVNASTLGPAGSIDGSSAAFSISLNSQLRTPEAYGRLVVRSGDGTAVRLSDIATVEPGVRNSRSDAWFDGKPAVLLNITKEADANVIATVDGVKTLIPELQRLIPAGIHIAVLSDRTTTIHASVTDMQWTLVATICLVMAVVFTFLRRATPTFAAGVTVPLSLCGTFAAMWLFGLSIDNLSLMALAVSVGFVVDDAIVMIENIYANLESGMKPMRAALEGAKQIGFTVVSISLSLLAAFIPLFFMGGIVGRFFQTFSLTLGFTIVVSTLVSLTLTPMICGHRLRAHDMEAQPGLFARIVEGTLGAVTNFYGRTLKAVLHHRVLSVLVIFACVVMSAYLYVKVPKGFIPQDDTGFIQGGTQAATDISYPAMVKLQLQAADLVGKDPAVSGVGSSVGGGGFSSSVNRGQLFISLKPESERVSTAEVIDRLRKQLMAIPGLSTFLFSPGDIRAGARQSQSQYQFTIWGANYDELVEWAPKVLERLQALPELTDVATDRQPNGLQATVNIDRSEASRLGVSIQSIDAALNNAFAQRQVSTIYTQRNQYRVVLEANPDYARDPHDISKLYVPASGGIQVPLSAVASIQRTLAPLVVNHQGQYPSVTISYNLALNGVLQVANDAIQKAVLEMHLPDELHADFAGDAASVTQSSGSQPLLLLAALLTVYIVLGILYESLAHPLTIISTLPSAGLGALLALVISGTELTIIAFIGIILLIGLVKKNGIMMVDFALQGERKLGLPSEEAIYQACLKRFRPILMTTLAALMGAIPLIIATGPGAELRRPLGITIVGGLVVSQILTLYTTPIIYLMLAKLHSRWSAKQEPAPPVISSSI
ncbi:acriflavine resistance protein B [Agrobacterium rhizogenes]|uniref:efflux RND transporter permease subunit n=1 Tax=Rhizobium rhizogenes TaxID=359 RepID=UPI00123942CC|nr:efflux RND transporter permease subunit [Rhizobium rhizogenes]KAA6485340.1 acriflavine resistance protein B [Agrobacterium sp. ICMP 7243]NTF50151.1 acriflavine resistance protein B [Rhizobium rhizogenes]NTH07533.1 acriflavine resistance protein B [Rhizobium rhizogenes]NTI88834.1 acriflavine resistance protein B [Rhizobium rhizogenes]NTJ33347.1 acriflavine resistance protein B [Rhizobium rhizogenes]